jgi:hypothetical protein
MVAGAILAGLIAFGLVIVFQGWQSRNPDWDVTHSIVQAVAIVERGAIPARDNLTDFNSFFPPGTTWLTVPGVLLFDDPRLVELLATSILYVLTIAGVFLVGRRYFGVTTALLAVAIYAFSYVALRLGTELWPRGHPVFYIWIAWFAGRWVDRRNAWYLAGAIVVWAAAMYVHLENAPALFMLPAVWWVYRPPITWRPVAVAAAITFVMWMPYLQFEWERGFIDVQSQVLRRTIDQRGDEVFGCGHVVTANPVLQPPKQSTPAWARERGPAIADLLLANLQSRVLAGEMILLALFGYGLLAVIAPPRAGPDTRRSIAIPIALIAGSVLITEFMLRWMAAPGSGVAEMLLYARRVHVVLLTVIAAWVLRRRWPSSMSDGAFVVIALIAPWMLLLALTELGRVERLYGIWPLQALIIAAGVSAAVERARLTRTLRWIACTLIVAVVAANLVLLGRSRDWMENGWAGKPVPVLAANFRTLACD